MNQMNTPLRIMVTGGAGFLGSHLCDRLLNSGHDVLCVDNFYTSTRRNITHLREHPNFELMRPGDTTAVYADPALAEQDLNWKAERSIGQMCADAHRWQSKNPSGYP